MSSKVTSKVPPDGGYGWVVTFAYALNNVVVLPLITSFGLIFQEAFEETGLPATQGALVIILNHTVGMLTSFLGSPVLSRFGYRKVAVAGSLLIAIGLMLTAAASNFWVFLIAYSIINSAGVGAVMTAFSLAINSFFKEKRSRAIGVGMSLTGLGGIGMPLLISALMYAYGWRYAVLTLSAICLHSLVAACLLRPAKWYLITPPTTEETEPLKQESQLINGSITPSLKNGLPSLSDVGDIKTEVHPSKSLSMRSLASATSLQARNAVSHPDILNKNTEATLSDSKYKWWESQEINLGSSINIFNETDLPKKAKESEEVEEKPNKSYLDSLIALFDLTLLSDPIFVNIICGLSIAGCVETNFSLLLPIILKDMLKFETSQIAQLMAIIGLSDTLFRLVAPFIGEWCHKPPRVMYMLSLVVVIFIRTVMLLTNTFVGMCLVALALGVAKGVRTVYMNVVVPAHVPLHRLPYASGIQMFANGITIVTLGSLLGRVRESSGSYQLPILVLNVVTFVTIVLWSAEFLYFKIKNKKPNSDNA